MLFTILIYTVLKHPKSLLVIFIIRMHHYYPAHFELFLTIYTGYDTWSTLSPKFSNLQKIMHGLQHFNAPKFQNYTKVSTLYNKNKHDVILKTKFQKTTLMLLNGSH